MAGSAPMDHMVTSMGALGVAINGVILTVTENRLRLRSKSGDLGHPEIDPVVQ